MEIYVCMVSVFFGCVKWISVKKTVNDENCQSKWHRREREREGEGKKNPMMENIDYYYDDGEFEERENIREEADFFFLYLNGNDDDDLQNRWTWMFGSKKRKKIEMKK